jgi:hypothetical protein
VGVAIGATFAAGVALSVVPATLIDPVLTAVAGG